MMTESILTLGALADRLAALERSNQRLKGALWGMVAAAAACATLAMAGDQTIRARAVYLLDDSGKPRILLSARAGLSMLDAQDRPRIVLSIDGEGPGLALYGETSRVGMIANINHDGPALTMRDNQGRIRAMLAAIDQGPGLILWDDKDRESAALVSRGAGGSLTLLDSHGGSKWHAP
jgi:hypothetical protein